MRCAHLVMPTRTRGIVAWPINGMSERRAPSSVLSRLLQRLRAFDRHVLTADGQRAAVSLIVAAVVVFVPLFSAWQVTLGSAGAATPLTIQANTGPQPTEPVFSIRRIARTTAIEARVAKVRTQLATLSAKLPQTACLVVLAESRSIATTRAQRALIPASNMKLLVAAAALDVLGADYRFTTLLFGNRSGAAVLGDLWLVGGGDPVLSTRAYPPTQTYPAINPTYLETLADELVASGVTLITGAVVGDESRYDTERYVPTWGDGIRAIEAGPLGALMADDGVLVGEPFKPANPATGAATAFTRLLQARGVTVIGAARSGVVPPTASTLGQLTSAPLSDILADLLTNSDNNVAELLLKEIGLVNKQQATRVAGLETITEVLEARAIPVEGLVLADGSGLDSSNQVSCQLLVTLLNTYGINSPLGQALAVAGATGTLREQLTTGPALNRVRAKTGTLRLAKSLSGFFPVVDASGQSVITFAFVLNGPGISNKTSYQPLWNELMQSLAAFSATPTTDDLLPRP